MIACVYTSHAERRIQESYSARLHHVWSAHAHSEVRLVNLSHILSKSWLHLLYSCTTLRSSYYFSCTTKDSMRHIVFSCPWHCKKILVLKNFCHFSVKFVKCLLKKDVLIPVHAYRKLVNQASSHFRTPLTVLPSKGPSEWHLINNLTDCFTISVLRWNTQWWEKWIVQAGSLCICWHLFRLFCPLCCTHWESKQYFFRLPCSDGLGCDFCTTVRHTWQ